MKEDIKALVADHIAERGYTQAQLQLCVIGEDGERSYNVLGRYLECMQLNVPETHRLREELRDPGDGVTVVYFNGYSMALTDEAAQWGGMRHLLGDPLIIDGHYGYWCQHSERGVPAGILATAIRNQL